MITDRESPRFQPYSPVSSPALTPQELYPLWQEGHRGLISSKVVIPPLYFLLMSR